MKDDDPRTPSIVEAVELERSAVALEGLLDMLTSNYEGEKRYVEQKLTLIRLRQGELRRLCGGYSAGAP